MAFSCVYNAGRFEMRKGNSLIRIHEISSASRKQARGVNARIRLYDTEGFFQFRRLDCASTFSVPCCSHMVLSWPLKKTLQSED